MKMIFKILLLLIILLISCSLFFLADFTTLMDYNSALVSMSLGIATFSVSFSFLQYQFSPYKALLRSISKRHLLYCYLLVLVALIPLTFLILNERLVPAAGIFCIPLLTYGAIILPLIANEETNPRILLNNAISKRKLKSYLFKFKLADAQYKKKQENLDFTWPNETPMHNFSSKYNASLVAGDPFSLILNIVELAIKNGDQVTFEHGIQNFFTITDSCIAMESVDYKSGFRFSVDRQINETFISILGHVVATKNTSSINYLIYAVGNVVKEKAFVLLQTTAPFNNFINELVSYARTAMDSNRDGVIYVSSLCRQLAQKGIYESDSTDDKLFFKNDLTSFAYMIKNIGQDGVKQNNSDIVFRSLEDLGFLGCTAVKQNHFQLIIECLQGLVQVGREARANNVKCFWQHCALEMIDHAEERIDWMVTWLPRLPESDRRLVAESVGTAYSRLHGVKWTISLEMIGEKLGVVYNKSDEKYVERYSKDRYLKIVDYSDKNEIKEFKLY